MLTLIVYSLCFMFLVGASYVSNHNQHKTLIIYSSTLFISIILGLRYEVGTDWSTYELIYENSQYDTLSFSGIEPLFILIYKCLNSLELPYFASNIFIVFIQLLLTQKFASQYPKYSHYIISFFFLCGALFSYLNIQRQGVAISIFLFSLKYLINREKYKFLACTLLAFLFHYSAVILPIAYLITSEKFKFIDSQATKITIYISSFFSYAILYSIITFVISYIANPRYIESFASIGRSTSDFNSGLGILLLCYIDILLLAYSNRIANHFKKEKLNLILRIYLLGVFLSNMAWNDLFLQRLSLYFIILRFVIAAFFVVYIWKTWKRQKAIEKINSFCICGSYLAICTSNIYTNTAGCSPFQFVFIQ